MTTAPVRRRNPRAFVAMGGVARGVVARGAVALAAGLLMSACQTAPADTTAAFSSHDSAGVTMVENRVAEWTDATRWWLDSVPITRVGDDESDVQQQFSSVSGATRFSNGNVMVSTRDDVRLFDADGKFVKLVARAGNGPGEFRSITTFRRLVGDSVLVSQSIVEGGMKNVVFNGDGTLVREERPDMERWRKLGRWRECQTTVLPDRSRVSCQSDSTIPLSATNRVSRVSPSGMSSPGPGLLRELNRQYVVPASLDTAYPIAVGAGIEQYGVTLPGKSGETFVMHPFYSRALLEAGGTPLRIVTMLNPAYRVEVWTPQGKLERVITRVGGQRAPNAEELADAKLASRGFPRQLDAATNERMQAEVPIPDSLPAGIAIRVTTKGEILVLREGHLPSHQHSVYDVFSAEGRWLGEFRLPRRTSIREVGDDYILTVRSNEDDVPLIEVLRLHRPTKASATRP